MRSNERKRQHNRGVKTRLKNLEKRLNAALKEGDRELAVAALAQVESAMDKAAKTGVIHWAKANRKKSRLAVRLHKALAAA